MLDKDQTNQRPPVSFTPVLAYLNSTFAHFPVPSFACPSGLGLEPLTSAFCYLNFRNAVGRMQAVPGRPGTFLAEPAAPLPEPFLENPPAPEGVNLPVYHWSWLDGRYIYYARGREVIDRHYREMANGDWREGLEVIEDRIEQQLEESHSKEAQEQRMKAKALGLPDPRAEK